MGVQALFFLLKFLKLSFKLFFSSIVGFTFASIILNEWMMDIQEKLAFKLWGFSVVVHPQSSTNKCKLSMIHPDHLGFNTEWFFIWVLSSSFIDDYLPDRTLRLLSIWTSFHWCSSCYDFISYNFNPRCVAREPILQTASRTVVSVPKCGFVRSVLLGFLRVVYTFLS